jgi:glycerate dehydrogenase
MDIVITFKASDKFKPLIDNALADCANITYLFGDNIGRKKALKSAEVIFSWNISKELSKEEYGYFEKLKFIQLLSAGANHLPFDLINENVIIASNVGAYAKPMAEHTLAMILALAKSLFVNHQKLRNGVFDQYNENKRISGSTCGILGFGGIGKETAKLLKVFNVKVYAINTSGKTNEPVDFIGTLKDLNYVLGNSDIVVIALPLNKSTEGLIDEKCLKTMKKDAIIVNIARGEIIVEDALFKHLKDNPAFKAGIDAWWIEPFSRGEFRTNNDFFALQNFIGSPHNSAIVPGAIAEALTEAIANIRNYLQGSPLKGIVKRQDYI